MARLYVMCSCLCLCHFPMLCPGSGVALDCFDNLLTLPVIVKVYCSYLLTAENKLV